MKRLVTTCLTVSVVALAMAMSSFGKVFDEKYSIKKDSNIGKAACSVCHIKKTGGKLNPYGKDLQAAMKEAKAKTLTAEVLGKVEGKSSTKGKTNLEKIKADILPGAE
jgi:hypothetical protein